jgi:hypothetical protein
VSNGKGSSRRPSDIPKAMQDANWERTFGDVREEMRQQHLREAKTVIDSAPPYILPCTTEPHD